MRNEKFVIIINKRNDLDLWNEILNKTNRLKNLILIPKVHFSLIDDYFENAKIFINTSIHEGFPNTFIQALKNRTPIVSLNVNPDNFLNIYKCGFYCEDDFSQLLKNVKELLHNKKLYEDFSKNAYFYAKNNHDLKMISSQWKQLINYLYNVNNIQHK